jgi:hypothetical protein
MLSSIGHEQPWQWFVFYGSFFNQASIQQWTERKVGRAVQPREIRPAKFVIIPLTIVSVDCFEKNLLAAR